MFLPLVGVTDEDALHEQNGVLLLCNCFGVVAVVASAYFLSPENTVIRYITVSTGWDDTKPEFCS